MSEVVAVLATAVTAAGVLVGITVLLGTSKALFALSTALELWSAAGILRLFGEPGWRALVTAAVVLALRQLVGYAQRHPAAGTRSTRSTSAGAAGRCGRSIRLDWRTVVTPQWTRPPRQRG